MFRRSFIVVITALSSAHVFATQQASPKVLVNHDIYSHTLQPVIEGGNAALSPIGQGHDQFLKQITRAHNDVSANSASRFTLNLSYGSHLLSYWNHGASYKDWLCSVAGDVLCRSSLLKPVSSDNLIAGKLVGRNILTDYQEATGIDRGKSVSVRMNDHHHLERAEEFFSPPISPANRIRRLSAMSPEYLKFVAQRKVLRSKKGSLRRGQIGSGPVCDIKTNYLFLDFSDAAVRSFKVQKIASLIQTPGVTNVELDFTRSACLFPLFSSLKLKQDSISALLNSVDSVRDQVASETGRYVELTVRVPYDVSVQHTGLNLSIMAARQQVDAIIIGRSLPYLDPSVLLPRELVRAKRGKIKVYRELYHIADAVGSVRRNAAPQEVYTAANQAFNFGFDGVSLFNFQYIFSDNNHVASHMKYEWGELLDCISSKSCLNQKKRSYFFSRRNAQSSKMTVSTRSPALIRVLMLNPRSAPTSRKRAYLRIQAERSSDDMKLRRGRVWAVVNGKKYTLSNVSRLMGVDPARWYPVAAGGKERWRSWKGVRGSKHRFIPLSAFRSGMNTIRVYRSGAGGTVPIRASLIFD